MSKRPGDPGYPDGWCIHYRYVRGSDNPTCEAGMSLNEMAYGKNHKTAPCFLMRGQPKPGARSCSKLRLPTPEEIAAHNEWSEQRIKRLGDVMVGIADWRAKHRGTNHAEIVECPACKGRLHLAISRRNGHVHGRCETEGCVSWME